LRTILIAFSSTAAFKEGRGEKKGKDAKNERCDYPRASSSTDSAAALKMAKILEKGRNSKPLPPKQRGGKKRKHEFCK